MTPFFVRVATLSAPFMFALAACGQLTGLSDDYEFDRVDGGTADAAADAITTDAPSGDALADAADAAKSCSSAAIGAALQQMSSSNATTTCKACLASSCCNDVDACGRATDCNRVFSCKLDCTAKTGNDRQQCFTVCNNQGRGGGGAPALYTNGIGACSSASCKADCAFQ